MHFVVLKPWIGPVEVRIGPPERCPPAGAEAIEREWERLVAANPRLHDGEIVRWTSVDDDENIIRCRRSSYKHFVAGRAGGMSVTSFGVTGVCVRRKDGVDEVLMGRRAEKVRAYGGFWETAPRGGVEARGRTRMNGQDLAACVLAEAAEELGPAVKLIPRRWLAIVHDLVVESVDLVLFCSAECDERPEAGEGNWEYTARRWVSIPKLQEWVRTGVGPPGIEQQELSIPCAELIAWSGFSGFGDTRSSTL